MNEKLLTDESGDVRELMSADMRAMRSAAEALPPELLAALSARSPGHAAHNDDRPKSR